jgi:hypothetical protein
MIANGAESIAKGIATGAARKCASGAFVPADIRAVAFAGTVKKKN